MSKGAVGLLIATVLATSCSTVTPVKISAGDQCFRCRRLITDGNLAAEMVDGSFVTTYKTAGCLAKYLADHPSPAAAVFVTDYPTGTLVSPARVLFVPVVIDRVTNETDYRAYLSATLATATAAEFQTQPLDWKTVLSKAKL
jgi:hypothetical protein